MTAWRGAARRRAGFTLRGSGRQAAAGAACDTTSRIPSRRNLKPLGMAIMTPVCMRAACGLAAARLENAAAAAFSYHLAASGRRRRGENRQRENLFGVIMAIISMLLPQQKKNSI